jgi:hypothetical protein
MFVYPIIKWKEVGDDIDLARSRVCETEPNSDGLSFCVDPLDRRCNQIEAVVTGLILASIKGNSAEDKAEKGHESVSHTTNCTWNWSPKEDVVIRRYHAMSVKNHGRVASERKKTRLLIYPITWVIGIIAARRH